MQHPILMVSSWKGVCGTYSSAESDGLCYKVPTTMKEVFIFRHEFQTCSEEEHIMNLLEVKLLCLCSGEGNTFRGIKGQGLDCSLKLKVFVLTIL